MPSSQCQLSTYSSTIGRFDGTIRMWVDIDSTLMFILLFAIAVIAYAIAPPSLTTGPYDETAQTFWF